MVYEFIYLKRKKDLFLFFFHALTPYAGKCGTFEEEHFKPSLFHFIMGYLTSHVVSKQVIATGNLRVVLKLT